MWFRAAGFLVMGASGAFAQRPPSTGEIGAPSSREAVVAFMRAIDQQDFARLGRVWGTPDALMRDRFPTEFERRAIIMSCYLRNLGFRIVGEAADTGRAVLVSIVSSSPGSRTKLEVRTVQNAGGRWLVEQLDLSKVSPAPGDCRREPTKGASVLTQGAII